MGIVEGGYAWLHHQPLRRRTMQTFHPPYRFASQATQIALFVALWLLADRLTRALHSGVPAGVLALFLVLGLLLARVVSQRHIEAGARRLLAELPLFFIPPLLSITESGAVFAQYGWSLIAACYRQRHGDGLYRLDRGLRVPFRKAPARRGEADRCMWM